MKITLTNANRTSGKKIDTGAVKAVGKALGTLGLLLGLSFTAFAGPEHDHGAPSFQPKYGGTIESGHHTHLEMVLKENKGLLYVYDDKGNAIKPADVTLNVTLDNPKTKEKGVPVTMTAKEDHFETDVDFKGSHRITYKIQFKTKEEKDYVKFTFSKK